VISKAEICATLADTCGSDLAQYISDVFAQVPTYAFPIVSDIFVSQ